MNGYKCKCEPGYFGLNCDTKVKPCPTESTSHYLLIENQCYFFENKTLTHEQAKHNCKNKFRGIGVGKLFEPTSNEINKLVSQKGWVMFGRSVWVYIGIDDLTNEGKGRIHQSLIMLIKDSTVV